MTTSYREAAATPGAKPTLEQTIAEGRSILASESRVSGPDLSLERMTGDLTARRVVELQDLANKALDECRAEYSEKETAIRRVQQALKKAGNH